MLTLMLIFALVFVVGPYAYLLVLRRMPSRKQFGVLAAISLGATTFGFALRFLSGEWGQSELITYTGILAVWMAWIAIVVFVIQMLRQNDERLWPRRWMTVTGALATTIPWFGLVSALKMTS